VNSASTVAELLPWHSWANTIAYALLGTLLLFAFGHFVLAAGNETLNRMVRGGTLRRSLVVGLSIVGSLPVFALGIILAERSAQSRVERTAYRLQESAEAVSYAIDQFIDKHLSGITSAASAISAANSFDEAQMTHSLLLYHKVYSDFLTMLNADANGDIVTATSNMTGFLAAVPDLQAHNVGDREYFKEPMATGSSFVSQVFQGRNLGSDPIVGISAPLRNDDGALVGIIEGSLDLRAFERIDNERAGLHGAVVLLTDQNGRVIYSSESAGFAPLENISGNPLLTTGSTAGHGTVYRFDADSNHDPADFLGVASQTHNGWTLYLRVPLDVITAQLLADYRSAALLGFIAWLVSLVLALAIVRRVTQSIADMNAAIASFDLDTHDEVIRTPANTFAEFRPLFRQIRERSKKLKTSYRRLSGSIAAGDELRSKLTRAIVQKEAEVADRTADLEEANERLRDLSKVDALTGIANRREFDAYQKRIWRLGKRESSAAAIVLLDIDYFKIFNDKLGHQAGDQCLTQVAQAISTCAARPLDLVARYGGEEFVAVLGNTTMNNALVVASRMRNAVVELEVSHPGSNHDVVTVSVGVAAAEPTSAATAEEVLQNADEALYYAKAAGRNCVVYRHEGEFETFVDDGIKLDETNVLSILVAKRG